MSRHSCNVWQLEVLIYSYLWQVQTARRTIIMMRMMRTATIAPTADSGKPTFEIKKKHSFEINIFFYVWQTWFAEVLHILDLWKVSHLFVSWKKKWNCVKLTQLPQNRCPARYNQQSLESISSSKTTNRNRNASELRQGLALCVHSSWWSWTAALIRRCICMGSCRVQC